MIDKIKSLEARLKSLGESGAEGKEKVKLLLKLAEALVSGDDVQRMIEVSTEVCELSRRLKYRKGEAYGLLYGGVSCCFVARHEEGLKQVSESRTLFEDLQDGAGVAKTELMEGNLLRSIGSFDQALTSFYKALDFFRRSKDPYWEAMTNYDVGLLHLEIRDYPKALEHFRSSLDVISKMPEQRWLEARLLNGVGTALRNMGEHEDAIDHHHRSLTLFREVGNRMGEARALDDIGAIHLELGDAEMALQFHTKGLDIRRAIGLRRAECTSLLNIARAEIARGDADAAITALDEALVTAEETKSKPQIYAAHRLLSEAYERRGEPAEALRHFRMFEQVREDVFNDQTSEKIHRLQIGFAVETAKKEAEIAHLKNVELKEKNEELENLVAELKATQSQLVQAEKMAALGSLVAGVVHEMNTPMGASNTAMDVCQRCIDKIASLESTDDSGDVKLGPELRALLKRIRDSHRVARDAHERMSKILSNLKSFIRLDGSERECVDLHEGLDATLGLLQHQWKDRVQIVRNYGSVPPVDCSPGEINQVFMTLLTNAVESIDGTGTVAIATSAANGVARIEISDTGTGIEPERLRRLFDPRFSTKGPRVKAGMGLFVSLNIVQKHGGSIDVESTPGVGSTFTVTLPVAK